MQIIRGIPLALLALGEKALDPVRAWHLCHKVHAGTGSGMHTKHKPVPHA